jgi:hypothetical protein
VPNPETGSKCGTARRETEAWIDRSDSAYFCRTSKKLPEQLTRQTPSHLVPGDIVKVSSPAAPELSQTQKIATDGILGLPSIGKFSARRKTVGQLLLELARLYTPRQSRRQPHDHPQFIGSLALGELYENEVALLREGQTVTVALPPLPKRSFQGKIVVIGPTIDPAKRTAIARIDVQNPDGQLRPDMCANVVAEIDCGEGLTICLTRFFPTDCECWPLWTRGPEDWNLASSRLGGSSSISQT